MGKHAGRSGYTWKKLRATCLAEGRKRNTPCALCGKPIDYLLKRPNPWAPQADHIVPLSDLPPGDKRRERLSNLRPVHAYCNQRRGNGRRLRGEVKQVTQTREWI